MSEQIETNHKKLPALSSPHYLDSMVSPFEQNRIFRVLDANRNRAIEGVRTLEEFARFVLEHRSLAQELKAFRHRLSQLCAPFADRWILQRDSDADVGTTISVDGEYERRDIFGLVAANASRTSEALRPLEEYGKIVEPEFGKSVETLRYLYYELEKKIKRFAEVRERLSGKLLYVLTSACSSMGTFESRIQRLLEENVSVIQLREKDLDDGSLLERARVAGELCRQTSTLFIVNDRPDIALLSGADGVHLGQEELPVRLVRQLLPANMLIGVSTHSVDQALQAEADGADYIGVGPTFPSQTKCFTEFTGTKLLANVATRVSLPAFAIGGVNLDNVSQVVDAGFVRVAVSNAIHSDESGGAASRFLEILKAAHQRKLQTQENRSSG